MTEGKDEQKPQSDDMTKRCRICLIGYGCMTSLQSNRVEDKLKDLIKCTCIEIKYDENLPGVVCHTCLYKLDMWGEFKERFIQSNKVLLEQLMISEASDNTVNEDPSNAQDEDVQRKRKSGKDNNSEVNKKKSKMDVSSTEIGNVCDTGENIIIDTIYISSDDKNDKSDSSKPKKTAKNGDHAEVKMYPRPMRARLLPARRGRNIERRKASTKRWVERKKALLAATGDMSDTDSVASDNAQLSPVQKARAKTNVDKELERQKKVAKVLKTLETNLTEKFLSFRDKDTDSDTRRTRLSKELHSSPSQQKNKNSLLNIVNMKNMSTKSIDKNSFSLDISMDLENSPTSLTNNIIPNGHASKSTHVDDQSFVPHLMKSELVVGDITYAVTSRLVLLDSANHTDKVDLNNLTKDFNTSNPDENNQEKNTDIIDAVQLRRIKPQTRADTNKSNNKFVERCLNIEVEGDELTVLKRVQYGLAEFVEKDMKQKLLSTNDGVTKKDIKINTAAFRQRLDQKLKDIIELAIKKNINPSIMKQLDVCNQGSTRFSLESIKTAMNSPKYQPKIVMNRLDVTKESKRYNINNASVLTTTPRSVRPFAITRKRQSIKLPARYNDFNVSTLDSDTDVSDDDNKIKVVQQTPKATNTRTFNMTTRQSAIIVDKSTKTRQEDTADYEEALKMQGAITENHICGVCGFTFHSRKDVETHVRTHKIITASPTMQIVQIVPKENTTSSPKPRQGKQKMMRCKRCHEIVEASLVKGHVCKTSLHKCYVCDSMFRTKNLLAKHLESHDQSEFDITNAIGNKKLNNADALLDILSSTPQKDQAEKIETVTKTQVVVSEKNDIQSDKISSTGVKLDGTENIVRKSKETYTCFVCDKIFTDEEVLKDHLQKHCDDLSEGEQSKEQYQCAICGNSLESDQALEEHVSKHLFDDEDDNPNLISIDQSSGNNKLKETKAYRCDQCSDTFESEMLLEMHMQEHEEEHAIAEWEKQGMKVYQYQCMLCDELFDSEEQLAEHLDVHNANAQVCQLCDKPFRTLEDLQKHVATH